MRNEAEIKTLYDQVLKFATPHCLLPADRIKEIAQKIFYKKLNDDIERRLEDLEINELAMIMKMPGTAPAQARGTSVKKQSARKKKKRR